MAAAMSSKMMRSAVRPTVSRRPVVAKAALETQLVISGSTAAMLFIGRTVFLPYQRKSVSDSGADSGPKTTGNTYFDSLQKDASFLQTTNDPEKFGLIDVFGWGALGHALGFFLLAAISLQSTVQAYPH